MDDNKNKNKEQEEKEQEEKEKENVAEKIYNTFLRGSYK